MTSYLKWIFHYRDELEAEQEKTARLNSAMVTITTQAFQYGMIEGEHHKQWVIDQMVRASFEFDPEPYDKLIAAVNQVREERGQEEWDVGIAP